MTSDREQVCAAVAVPAGMAAMIENRGWMRDTVGEAGAAVYRLHAPGLPDLFLKHGRGPIADDVVDEMVRLRWLVRHVPVPELRHFEATADDAWLLMSAMSGATAYQVLAAAAPEQRGAIVDALAAFLVRFHAIPVASCPFVSDHRLRLHHARIRIDAGLVDKDDFDDAREGWTAEQVWDAMNERLPFAPDPVVTHGDYSLDNLLVTGGAVTGCIDLGRVGIADRYQDIAIVWNCLGEFGPALQARFIERYGLAAVDRAKLTFHLMLDELF